MIGTLLAFLLTVHNSCGGQNPCTTSSGAVATGYFVDCSLGAGADSGPGTVGAPWGTLSKVNNTVTITSSKVWIKAGSVCADQTLGMDWSGTISDHASVGTYYVANGVPYVLAPDNPAAYPSDYTYSNGTRAQINGTYDSSCSATLRGSGTTTCAMGQDTGTPGLDPAAVPQSRYFALVQMTCNYCDVSNVWVKDSAGRGIDVAQVDYSVGYTGQRIFNNLVENIGGTGIEKNAGSNAHIYGNVVRRFSVGGNKADNQWPDHGSAIFIGVNDSSGNGAVATNGNSLIEKNDVVLGYGEGILVGKMGPLIVRGNRVGNTSDAPILMADSSDKVFEYNLVWGGSASSATPAAEYGIAIFPEASPGAPHLPVTNILIRGNLVAHSSNGVRIGAESSVWTQSAFTMGPVRVYNNTFVNVSTGVQTGVNATNPKFTGFEFKNNIVYNEAGGTLCVTGSLTGDTYSNNLWGSAVNANCTGTGDVIGNPLLSGSGFDTKTSLTSPPVVSDFALLAGSPALAVGTPLTSTLLSTATYPIYDQITYPCATFDLQGFVIDAVCRAVDAAPDLGALGR